MGLNSYKETTLQKVKRFLREIITAQIDRDVKKYINLGFPCKNLTWHSIMTKLEILDADPTLVTVDKLLSNILKLIFRSLYPPPGLFPIPGTHW